MAGEVCHPQSEHCPTTDAPNHPPVWGINHSSEVNHMGKRGSHRFYSKAQWRWAFATKKPWARRHAHRTPGGPKARFRRLPARKGVRKKR